MQKNQAGANEQRSAAGLFVLHLKRAERLLLANPCELLRIRGCFGLRGAKFANVVQFIS